MSKRNGNTNIKKAIVRFLQNDFDDVAKKVERTIASKLFGKDRAFLFDEYMKFELEMDFENEDLATIDDLWKTYRSKRFLNVDPFGRGLKEYVFKDQEKHPFIAIVKNRQELSDMFGERKTKTPYLTVSSSVASDENKKIGFVFSFERFVDTGEFDKAIIFPLSEGSFVVGVNENTESVVVDTRSALFDSDNPFATDGKGGVAASETFEKSLTVESLFPCGEVKLTGDLRGKRLLLRFFDPSAADVTFVLPCLASETVYFDTFGFDVETVIPVVRYEKLDKRSLAVAAALMAATGLEDLSSADLLFAKRMGRHLFDVKMRSGTGGLFQAWKNVMETLERYGTEILEDPDSVTSILPMLTGEIPREILVDIGEKVSKIDANPSRIVNIAEKGFS